MTPEVEAFLWDCRVRAIEASLGPLELPVSQQEAIRIVQALGYRCDEQTIRALERERWLQTPSDGQWGKDKLYQLILLSEADSLADRWFEREIGVARPRFQEREITAARPGFSEREIGAARRQFSAPQRQPPQSHVVDAAADRWFERCNRASV